MTMEINVGELRQMATDGLYDKEIADKFGCCETTILNWRRRYRIPSGRKVGRKNDMAEAYKMFALYYPGTVIADQLGIAVETVSRYRQQYIKEIRAKAGVK